MAHCSVADKHARRVPYLARRLDRGGTLPADRSKDRRVQKTQALLHEALSSLIHEKSYDAIIVKQILARANVGRSTFYTHFRDKEELLESGIRDMVGASGTASQAPSTGRARWLLRFSLPILQHIEQYRATSTSAAGARRQDIVHEHLQRVLVDLIVHDLRSAGLGQHERAQMVPPDLLANHAASTFVLVLTWWAESENTLSAREVDELLRQLLLPTLSRIFD